METTGRKFNVRAFVTFMIASTGLVLPVTGIANHVYGFSPPTTARHLWMTAHNVSGLIFTVFLVWHVVLNRRALWGQVRSLAARGAFGGRELLIAGAVAAAALLIVSHAFLAGE